MSVQNVIDLFENERVVNMKRFKLHSHSWFCDGKNTLEEMVLAAIEKGLYCFGFSAHAPVPFENNFALKIEDQESYLQQTRSLKEKYADTDRKTIYNSLNKYFPSIKKDFEQLQSDVIMQGGMMGKYNPTMSIFGLKNWCGWSDSGRVTTGRYDEEKAEDALSKALREEAERMQNETD